MCHTQCCSHNGQWSTNHHLQCGNRVLQSCVLDIALHQLLVLGIERRAQLADGVGGVLRLCTQGCEDLLCGLGGLGVPCCISVGMLKLLLQCIGLLCERAAFLSVPAVGAG